MDWILVSLKWYLYIFAIGLVFLPLTKKIFNRFSVDLGYPFAKVLAILLVSYSSFVLGILKIVKFDRINLFLIIGVFALINYYIFKKTRRKHFTSYNLLFIVIEEVLFLASLLFWVFIRSQEPSIRSLEKFMDFGFMNSILRSDYFPPLDIWYTPLPINYYYFGHLTGSMLIKLTNIIPSIGYNLILANIFALSVTQIFSIVANIISRYSPKVKILSLILVATLGAYIVNLGGNLHTIYLFTKGYPNDTPVPFWQIFSKYNPASYWYPNATRFIPYTIHEFPSYSYVVADLHGHVFDIPFVLLTLAILFLIFTGDFLSFKTKENEVKNPVGVARFLAKLGMTKGVGAIFLGFLTAVHYMTNAFDGPIYILLILALFFYIYRISVGFFVNAILLIFSFILFSFPFSSHFSPFVSGIGVNCAPDFFVNMAKFGPFIFEKGNCQISPIWMMAVLWGFFWISFVLLLIANKIIKPTTNHQSQIIKFLFILFSFGTFLVIIPEFFYIKDIYPQHFRANTMFKLGYQSFMMMGISSVVTFFIIKSKKNIILSILTGVWIFFAFFIVVYPFFSIPSYYGLLDKKPQIDGASWLNTDFPEDKEIIDYLNKNEKKQPVILEAQGDSYTDYERISAYTGFPTVAGWWVHEWLWRGSSEVVGERIPEVVTLYESKDLSETRKLVEKYDIKYVIVSRLERQKYLNLYDKKWLEIGKLIFKSSNGFGALYQVN